jgi:hypothetical protein
MKLSISVALMWALFGLVQAQTVDSAKDRLLLSEVEQLIKKKIPEPDPAPELANLRRILESFGLPKLIQGILVFSSNEHVIASLNYIGGLEKQSNFGIFQKTQGGQIDIGSAFNDQEAYERYEAEVGGFSSLRALVNRQAKAYLRANQTDDNSKDPDNHFVAEYALRTILNQYLEIGIGSEGFRITPEGYERYPSLEALIRSRIVIPQDAFSQAQSRKLQSTVSCFGTRMNSGTVTTGTRRIRWVIGIIWLPWHYRAYALTFNFRRVLWIWWPAHSWTFARVYGLVSADKWGKGCQLYREQCLASTEINMDFACYDYRWGLFASHWLHVYHKTSSGWLRGHHWGIATVGVASTLW